MNFDVTPTIITKRPRECSAIELQKFCELVLSEGQVKANTLLGYVADAESLAFIYYADELAAVAAIKNSHQSYRDKVKRKSGTDLLLEHIPHEFGYVVVAMHHRRKRLSDALADSLLRDNQEVMFATSTTDNDRMHRTLQRHGFKRTGKPYPSKEHPGKELAVFVRNCVVAV